MHGLLIGPGGLRADLPMTSVGYPIVPFPGQHVRYKGVDYEVADVLWDYDVFAVYVYVKRER